MVKISSSFSLRTVALHHKFVIDFDVIDISRILLLLLFLFFISFLIVFLWLFSKVSHFLHAHYLSQLRIYLFADVFS